MALKLRHSFEFMDLTWVPQSIRLTMREVLECAMSAPFRDYYDWVAGEVAKAAKERDCDTIVELGAGTAPLTRRLAVDPEAKGKRLVVCDLNPDAATYQALEKEFSGQVEPVYAGVDFARVPSFGRKALLVLSASFHHVREKERVALLRSLFGSSPNVLVFEPLRRNLSSVIYASFTFMPGLMAPAVFLKFHGLRRGGHLRRLFWCWLVPVVPFMLAWDGIVSCLRMWTAEEWGEALEGAAVQESPHKQIVDCLPATKASSRSRAA